jgi:outer membrane lipoprotein SlyB
MIRLNRPIASLGAVLLLGCAVGSASASPEHRYDDRTNYSDSRYDDARYDDARYERQYGDDYRYDRRYDDRYSYDRYGHDRCRSCGTIERIQNVWVQRRGSGGGAILGAIIGGAIGSNVGSGSGRHAAIAAGAVAGGVIGHGSERNRRDQRRGQLIDVRLDDGRWARVTQLGNRRLRVGDRVIVQNQQVHIRR